MVDWKTSVAYVRSKWHLFYPISFLSFWVALLLQLQIAKFLTPYIPATWLNIATIAVMWILAIFVLPIVGSIIIVNFMLRTK